ncbi:hypothetical protein [Alcanivorax sp. DG881]|jgi:hypothetical protein|uniref:hypothetical protein n=1 Tax=Alcanivorax sp. DG881 TaxID=236097 RepID=UPI00030C18DC|nr:hypothetical protein [Alcanivorax sp. DG881]
MTGRVLHTPIMLISVMMLALNGQALGAQEVESPQEALARALGARPEIRDYTRQDRFVTDLLAWQRHKSELEAKLARGESIAPPAPAPQPNWHHVTGPEDLDTALHNAQGYKQPNYQEPIRYDRTTHLSFPLPPLPQQQLSEKVLTGERPVPADPAKEEIHEELLEENTRLQREMAASRANLPPPELNRQHFVSHSQLR